MHSAQWRLLAAAASSRGFRYKIRFDVEQYLGRVHLSSARNIPAASIVCAPAACTPEMVGRFVFPELHVDGHGERSRLQLQYV